MTVEYTEAIPCGHCGNTTAMKILTTYSHIEEETDDYGNPYYAEGPLYEVSECPTCKRPVIRSDYYYSGMHPSEKGWSIIYPVKSSAPKGLPEKIEKAYEAASKVRTVDANAFAVLMGRMLEMICEDRGAVGSTLFKKLADLSKKGEIPEKLAGVVDGLRNLRNIGAHASLGELGSEEVPLLDALGKAILEYVYSAPFLAQQAEERLDALKSES